VREDGLSKARRPAGWPASRGRASCGKCRAGEAPRPKPLEFLRLRFQIETEAVARLQHPHIVQLYEAGEVCGQPFFSLEFLRRRHAHRAAEETAPVPARGGQSKGRCFCLLFADFTSWAFLNAADGQAEG
jgi:hypothetical protein